MAIPQFEKERISTIQASAYQHKGTNNKEASQIDGSNISLGDNRGGDDVVLRSTRKVKDALASKSLAVDAAC